MNRERFFWLRKQIFDPIAWQLSKRELHNWMQHDDIGTIVRASQDYVGRGFYASIRAVQSISEITELAKIVRQQQPRVIVEIGTYKGGTLYIWCRASQQAELVVSIDLPGGMYGGGYDRRRVKLYREYMYDNEKCQMHFIRDDSHKLSTLNQLISILGDRKIDFLYIDGDHTYSGVRKDYDMYASLVSSNGIVAFHDIDTRTQSCQVYEFWNEIKRSSSYLEFIDGGSSNKGIGVLYK